MAAVDYRARLQPKSTTGTNADTILGPKSPSNILFPLWSTGGVLFPYTPQVSTGSEADYDPSTYIQSIYQYNAYIRSYPKSIGISAEFTAQSNDEAMYLLAVLHFFRSVTKSYFGINPYNKAGTPPPTLLFNYLGDYGFNNVPVIIKSFDYTYDENVNYVPVNTNGQMTYSNNIGVKLPPGQSQGWTYVPTHLRVTLALDTQYVPYTLRTQFNLDKFRTGALINQGYI